MPAGELIGFAIGGAVQLGGQVLLMIVGTGETRLPVIVRAIFHLCVLVLCAVALWLLILVLSHDFIFWALPPLPVALLVGFMSGNAAISEIRKLRHWGEPLLMADPEGLVLCRSDRMIPWRDITEVRPSRRGVRIFVAGQRPVLIATVRADELAAEIQFYIDPHGEAALS